MASSRASHAPAPAPGRRLEAVRPVVLVVDDHPDTGDILTEYLRFHGARAVRASNVAEAHALLGTLRIDVVVTDYAMPGGNGLELLGELRRSPSLASVPVVMVSAHDSDGQVAEVARMKGATFVAKPFDLRELLTAVESALATVAPS